MADKPWSRIAIIASLVVVCALAAWEWRCRAAGYGPTLNDTSDLWAEHRRRVEPDSLVLIGASRMLFNTDLDVVEDAFGKRPIQLALVGSSAYPILAHLADDETFRGTVVCGMVPAMFFAPGGPPVENSLRAIKRYETQSPAQRLSHALSKPLEQHLAFIQQEDLTLAALLKQVEFPNRKGALVPPLLPPYFYTIDHERRARMVDSCAVPGELQETVKGRWLPLFTPPPPPSYVPIEKFVAGINEAFEKRFRDTAEKVAKIRARGGNVIFVRMPVDEPLLGTEEKLAPRKAFWDRLLAETGAPGIHFEDHPDLQGFPLPEWSHLSGPDSVEFTKRLMPHLRNSMATLVASAENPDKL